MPPGGEVLNHVPPPRRRIREQRVRPSRGMAPKVMSRERLERAEGGSTGISDGTFQSASGNDGALDGPPVGQRFQCAAMEGFRPGSKLAPQVLNALPLKIRALVALSSGHDIYDAFSLTLGAVMDVEADGSKVFIRSSCGRKIHVTRDAMFTISSCAMEEYHRLVVEEPILGHERLRHWLFLDEHNEFYNLESFDQALASAISAAGYDPDDPLGDSQMFQALGVRTSERM